MLRAARPEARLAQTAAPRPVLPGRSHLTLYYITPQVKRVSRLIART